MTRYYIDPRTRNTSKNMDFCHSQEIDPLNTRKVQKFQKLLPKKHSIKKPKKQEN